MFASVVPDGGGVELGVGVFVGVTVGVIVFVGVTVGVIVFVGVTVGVIVFVGVTDGVCVFVGVGVGDGLGAGGTTEPSCTTSNAVKPVQLQSE
jgi:hypothetical protein